MQHTLRTTTDSVSRRKPVALQAYSRQRIVADPPVPCGSNVAHAVGTSHRKWMTCIGSAGRTKGSSTRSPRSGADAPARDDDEAGDEGRADPHGDEDGEVLAGSGVQRSEHGPRGGDADDRPEDVGQLQG